MKNIPRKSRTFQREISWSIKRFCAGIKLICAAQYCYIDVMAEDIASRKKIPALAETFPMFERGERKLKTPMLKGGKTIQQKRFFQEANRCG